jgi:hypothetical protein
MPLPSPASTCKHVANISEVTLQKGRWRVPLVANAIARYIETVGCALVAEPLPSAQGVVRPKRAGAGRII